MPTCSSYPPETVLGPVIPTYKQITQRYTGNFGLEYITEFHLSHYYIGLLKPQGKCNQITADSPSMHDISQVHPGIRRAYTFVSVRWKEVWASHRDCTLKRDLYLKFVIHTKLRLAMSLGVIQLS